MCKHSEDHSIHLFSCAAVETEIEERTKELQQEIERLRAALNKTYFMYQACLRNQGAASKEDWLSEALSET